MRSLRKSLKTVVSSIAIKFVIFFCLFTEHLGVELKRVRAFQAAPDRTGTWKCSFLRIGEKSGVPGENPLGARERTNNKLSPHGSHL